MKQLLEQSKQQLLTPLGEARRKLLIILNIVYIILVPFFLISEKIAHGAYVNDSLLYVVYGIAILCNLLSAVYNIRIYLRSKHPKPIRSFSNDKLFKSQRRLDSFFGYASVLPILFMSFCHMVGFGNPFNDSILTDFALAQSLMIVVVMIIGRIGVFSWFLIIVVVLIWNVSERGWDYEYHYATPTEVAEYKTALALNEPWALKRATELDNHKLQPPRITRYFNIWMVFVLVTFLVAYFYSGVAVDMFKVIPSVIDNIEQASEESTRMELERKVHQEKTTTFINLAHETKTPLTLINNYLDEYVKKHGESPEMNIIKWNVRRLTTDIVNFFDLERFNKGLALYDHDQVCSLTTILQYKIPLFNNIAEKKGIHLQENIQEGCEVKAHPGALERIINNLIENAIKYTPAGGKVMVSLLKKEYTILLKISDSGVGIPMHLQEKIFEPYFQLGRNVKSNHGMGMGLSIVKKIVNEISGTIHLESDANQGTIVYVELQRFISPNPVSGKEAPLTDSNNFSATPVVSDKIREGIRTCILVVEDNVEMLNYLAGNLSERYNVYVAQNGVEALHKLQSIVHLDLIISDIMMDEMDGVEFYKNVSRNEFLQHIPFIFLTAKTTGEDKLNGLKLGALDYIEKPFLIDQLLLKIEAVLSNFDKQRSAIIRNAYQSLLRPVPNKESGSVMSGEVFESNCLRYKLTTREVEIITLIIKGQSNKMIGDALHISNRTVDRHVANVFAKVSVNSKIELINKLYSS